MATTNRKSAKKAAAPAPRDAYISFNKDEWSALEKLGFRERWAYMQFKWLANFKTGMVGNFRKQRLTFQDIAKLVTAPGVQGRGMGDIDDTQAADFVLRLAAVGLLVRHPNRDNGGIMFELPLSPIARQASALTNQAVAPAVRGDVPEQIFPNPPRPKSIISPDDDIPPFDENPADMAVGDASDLSLSVMALTKLKNNTDGARAADADAAPPSRANGAAAALENPHKQPQAAAPLIAREIHAVIAGNWTFSQTNTPEAWSLYTSWEDAGITLDDLHAAMTSLEEDASTPELTPVNLAPKLWSKVVDGWVEQLAA
ncbi:hypothetical protein F2P44_20165 [Massilia sp. CCM 8695]|uniref:Uncharacterized protein n=1 Tax=Massilia frigida TaxID=2609281 RepID=A0ABX0N8E5_9BURK|nr:hypothetical protein [Massilia frigida]NHZ81573.1 hypothetical protein [Massilia frigida]